MADDELRRLEREAAAGGPEEQAQLEAYRKRTETPAQALDRPERPRWANGLLRDLGLPLGPTAFERLITEVLRFHGSLFTRVYEGVPEDTPPP
jgi:hypothetical protein